MRVFCVEKREGLETPDKGWFYWRHGTSGSTRVWMFYQQRVVPSLGWMVLDSSRVICSGSLGVHGTSPRGGTFGEEWSFGNIDRCFMN